MAQPRNSTSAPLDGDRSADSGLDPVGTGKGRATPTRREREAANLRPLVSGDRKVANKAARAKMSEAREKARIGMANGEEKYLPSRDKGPQRRFIRDYVDARYSLGELLIPLMFIVILLSLVPALAAYSFIVLYAFFLFVVIDTIVVGLIITRKLSAKYGADNVQRGSRWYAGMRAIQMRPMRLPKAQVKRRSYPS